MEGIGVLVWLAIGVAAGLAGAAALALARGTRAVTDPIWAVAAALLGSFAWSEWFGDYSRWGGQVGGLQVAPAVLGAAIVAGLYVAGRLLEEGKETAAQ
ncbi:MAG TPA: hypothetical protein VNL95_09895 [Dehalococcoidia bacterium]|nr:hypothetical protein [Dehalococcoidia bacterium]